MTLSFDSPQMWVSVPKEVGWHMILDHELDQLSHSEMGFIGSLGFVGLGAALGLIPPIFEAFSKLSQKTPPITLTDMACVGAFVGSIVLAIVCLGIGGIYWHRNRGLARSIRQRGKQGFPTSVRSVA